MVDNTPLIYLIGSYEKPGRAIAPDFNDTPMALDCSILPPVPSSTQAYTVKTIYQHEGSLPDYQKSFLSQVLNLVAFIEQTGKKRKYFYDHGNTVKEALQYKLQTLSREFNETGKRTGQAVKQSIKSSRDRLSGAATFVTHGLKNASNDLNYKVNRVHQNLEIARHILQLNVKRSLEYLSRPPVILQKKHYATFISAGALSLTTPFVIQLENNNSYKAQGVNTSLQLETTAFDAHSKTVSYSLILPPEKKPLVEKQENTPSTLPITTETKEIEEPYAETESLLDTNNENIILEIPLADRFRISSHYGPRKHPVFGNRRIHKGIDIAAPYGTLIKAPATGTVTFAGRKGGYGKTVILDHGNGIKTLYAHLSQINVRKGTYIEKGDSFAQVGATGRVTGTHLHFEIHDNGKHTNPQQYIQKNAKQKTRLVTLHSP